MSMIEIDARSFALSSEAHEFALKVIFLRIGRVRKAGEVQVRRG